MFYVLTSLPCVIFVGFPAVWSFANESQIKVNFYYLPSLTQRPRLPQLRRVRLDFCAMTDISKPITFCEHLQLSSLAIQPSSIGFQVRATHLALLLAEGDSIIHVRWALL